MFLLSTETEDLTDIFPPMETRCAPESVSFDEALPSKAILPGCRGALFS
jgi:hypothetical protein